VSIQYEWGIARNIEWWAETPHRTGMTEEEALDWIADWIEMGGNKDAFFIVRRPIGYWVKA
jgi:hypothetical protein